MKAYLLLILLLILSILPAMAQESETSLFRNEKRNVRYNAGNPVFSPIILPAFTPEMRFIITGGCLVNFKTKRNNDYLRHSFGTFLANSDLNEGIEAYFNLNTFWLDDRLVFNFNTNFINRTDHYWGIGYVNAENIEQGENTTQFKNASNNINSSIQIRILENFYTGVKIDLNKSEATELSDLMLEDINILKDTNEIKTSGIGFVASYDSRDIPSNPKKGFLVSAEGLFYNNYLSGEYEYQYVGLDYKHTIPFLRKGSGLTWQLNAQIGFGNVPWCNLQKLGSSNDLRGNYYGQYRDKSLSILQIEYRHTFSGNDPNRLSRHGFVFWIGGGSVFPEINEINSVLFNTGIGYRFELQPNSNLRIDLGFGMKSVGIYVNFNESF